MFARATLSLAILLAAAALTGCSQEEERVPAVAEAEVTQARDRIRMLCREGAPRPDNLDRAVAGLIHVLRQYPERVVQGGEADRTRTLPEVGFRAAADLPRCGRPRLAARVRDAARAATS